MSIERCAVWMIALMILGGCATPPPDVSDEGVTFAVAAIEAPVDEEPPWMVVTRPGPEHEAMKDLTGRWTMEVKVFGDGPGDVTTLTGVVERHWTVGGRWLESRVIAEGPHGRQEGAGFLGFNVLDGVYERVWMDDQSTAISIERGHLDPDTKQLELRGTLRDPVSGALITTRSVFDVSQPDRHLITGFSTGPDGREMKIFEIVTRRAE